MHSQQWADVGAGRTTGHSDGIVPACRQVASRVAAGIARMASRRRRARPGPKTAGSEDGRGDQADGGRRRRTDGSRASWSARHQSLPAAACEEAAAARGVFAESAPVRRAASLGGRRAERMAQAFPEVSAETATASDYVCSLDHARIRWYGRIYVCRTCVCFAGTGISLSASSKRHGMSDTALASSSTMTAALPWSAGEPRLSMGAWSLQDTAHATRKLVHRAAIKIAFCDVTRISKELTLGFCPNAITVSTDRRQYIFTDLVRRDRAYSHLTERWAAASAMLGHEPSAVPLPPPRPALPLQDDDACAQRIRLPPAGHGAIGQAAQHPHVPASQLASEASRNTQFVLISVVLLCLLSTLVP
ncbi:hypothetical protein H4R19_000630 [Coemansia spiralis]|nr:hypothetical protein H4R19_000630 [Coemansia spiralis]